MLNRFVSNFLNITMNPRLCVKDFLIHVTQRRLKGFPVAILMYHSIAHNRHFFTVTPEEFRWQMTYLKTNGYHVVPLADVVEGLAAGRALAPKSVVLTFDDGYEDNFTNALPVLQEFGFPATVFVSIDFIGTTRNVRDVPLRHLSRPQIMEMQSSGLIDLEPHGLSHQKLSAIAPDEAEREMQESQAMLGALLGSSCKLFAYPYGNSDHAVRAMARHFFTAVVGVGRGYVSAHSDLMNLERQSIDSLTSRLRFRLKI